MVENNPLPVLLALSIVCGRLIPCEVDERLPNVPFVIEIVVPEDETLPALKLREDFPGAVDIVIAEIPQMPDDIVLSNDRVPTVDKGAIHFFNGRERPELEHESMPEMVVSGEILGRECHDTRSCNTNNLCSPI